MTIYEQLKAAGVPTDHHESDLYAKVTPESRGIINDYKFKCNVTTFYSQIDHELWFEIPFEFDPFWDNKPTGQRTWP